VWKEEGILDQGMDVLLVYTKLGWGVFVDVLDDVLLDLEG
jgi:hypothetical protein